jgi:hypothetical protein
MIVRTTRILLCGLCAVSTVLISAAPAAAQVVTERGFVEGRGTGFFAKAANDVEQGVADVLAREEVFVRPAPWFQFAAGLDVRANSHGQVADEWAVDLDDRGVLRPRLALRRLSATFSAGRFSVDLGKQFIRWGRADVVYPTDRFAPRDYLNVLDAEVLPVIAARPSIQIGSENIEAIATVQPTPTRLPLFDQRWAQLPPAIGDVRVTDGGSRIPDRPQYGIRWRHTGPRLETAVSYFDGANHFPNLVAAPQADGGLEVTRRFPGIRMVGGDVAVPTSEVTLKMEAAYVTAPAHDTDEYLLYVLEFERQVGEWLFDVGYAGDVTTRDSTLVAFAPDRGMARSVIGRAALTIDPRRNLLFEGAVRQDANGVYAKAEYSQELAQRLRFTVAGVGIGGERSDFIGQYRDNSHVTVGLRLSF